MVDTQRVTKRRASCRRFGEYSERTSLAVARAVGATTHMSAAYRLEFPSAGGIHQVGVAYTAELLGSVTLAHRSKDAPLECDSSRLKAAIFNQLSGDFELAIIFADPEQYVAKYGLRGLRYAYLEAGHVGQLLIQNFQSEGLDTCPIGAFSDVDLNCLLFTPCERRQALYAIATGEPCPEERA
jgi:nitroreductase